MYHTSFSLNVCREVKRGKTVKLKYLLSQKSMPIIDDLCKTNEHARSALTPEGASQEPLSWWQHEEDLVEFSRNYPDMVFELFGEGENNTDLWVCYFKNGKKVCHAAKITYPKFKPSDLKKG